MKVLILNGSPHPNGCTARALREVEAVLSAEGIETETITVGNKEIRGCAACNRCGELGRCVFDDIVNEIAAKFEAADGLIIGSPVYYAGMNGTLKALLDRLFYSSHFDKTMKVGASVAASRRAGSTSALDDMNKYFMGCMTTVSGTYWNEVYGFAPEDVEKDLEGLETMRNLGKNMAFLLKSIALGKEKFGLPQTKKTVFTSFPDGL